MTRQDAARACLIGTPYVLPSGPGAAEQINVLLERERRLHAKLTSARSQLRKLNLAPATDRFQETREVYESNAIEGLGPDLGTTWEILQSEPARSIDSSLDSNLLTKSITDDPDMNAVLGLHEARLLALRLQRDISRPWTEADLRSIHAVICRGESYAGIYKRFHVKIGGEGSHEPHLPIDVNPAMHELVTWWSATTNTGPSLLRAAAVHAWLTHIHPFEDGNGRIARILANVTLTRGGLAPAIVKHSNQRGPYLDALRQSDYGGDIWPLVSLFYSVVDRFAREISKPKMLEKVFQEEVARRGQSGYDWWKREFSEFMDLLRAALRLQGISTNVVGELDLESFEYLTDLDPSGNEWLATITNNKGREILLWFGYPSVNMRRAEEKVPSIFLAVPNSDVWREGPFRRPRSGELLGLTEFMLVPGVQSRVYTMQNERKRSGTVPDAAETIADIISRAMQQGRVPLRLPLGATPV